MKKIWIALGGCARPIICAPRSWIAAARVADQEPVGCCLLISRQGVLPPWRRLRAVGVGADPADPPEAKLKRGEGRC